MSSPSLQNGGIPERSLDQRLEALAHANHVRTLRATLKRDLKRGSVSITSVLRDPPEYLASARVMEVLAALPRCGHVRAACILERCRVSHKKTLGGLSERQRRELIVALEK